MILSHISCFIYREVIGFQVLLQYCGIITLSWSAYQTVQLDNISNECLCCGCAGVEEESLHAVWCPAWQVSDRRFMVHWPGLWLTVRWHTHYDVSSLPRTEGSRLWSFTCHTDWSVIFCSCLILMLLDIGSWQTPQADFRDSSAAGLGSKSATKLVSYFLQQIKHLNGAHQLCYVTEQGFDVYSRFCQVPVTTCT